MARLVFSGSLECEKREALSAYAQGVLTGIAESAGIEKLMVTSTIRTPRSQAEAMYNNIASGRYIRYRKAGQEVTNLCKRMIDNKESREKTIDAMVSLIDKLSESGERVSRHCVSAEVYAKCNIVDVARSMTDFQAELFMRKLAEVEDVVKIIQPISSRIGGDKISWDDSEPAIHIEIDIPEEYRV